MIPPLIFLISIFFTGCKEGSNPVIPDNKLIFRDSIPFNLLGKGIVCFQRIADEYNEGVCIIDVNNQKTRAISGPFNAPVISPDGAKIAYSGGTGSYELLYDIFIMNTDGTKSTDISLMKGGESYPSWSNDSKNLFYLNYYGGWTTLYDLNKNEIYKTTTVPQTPFSYFEPKGMIFYDGVGSGSKPTIKIFNTTTRNVSNLCTATGIWDIYTPRWSPDGTKIAFVQEKLDSMNNEFFNAGGIIQIYNTITSELSTIYEWTCDKHTHWAGDNELSICWSPDGSKLLFNRTNNGLESHIYIIDVDGSGLKQITSEPGVCDRSVSWSWQ